MRGRRGLPTGAAAVAALGCECADMYTGGPLAAYVPFEADRIAEPPEGAPEIDMLEVLPAVVAERYGDFSLSCCAPTP